MHISRCCSWVVSLKHKRASNPLYLHPLPLSRAPSPSSLPPCLLPTLSFVPASFPPSHSSLPPPPPAAAFISVQQESPVCSTVPSQESEGACQSPQHEQEGGSSVKLRGALNIDRSCHRPDGKIVRCRELMMMIVSTILHQLDQVCRT